METDPDLINFSETVPWPIVSIFKEYFFLIKLAVTNLSISIITLVLVSDPDAPDQFWNTYSGEATALIWADSPLSYSAFDGLTEPPFTGLDDVNKVWTTGSSEHDKIVKINATNNNFFIT